MVMPSILQFMPGASQSSDDPRFKFDVGAHVKVFNLAVVQPEGAQCQIIWRRNGYPEPFFQGYWFPIYFVELLEEGTGGGEVGEICLRQLE